MARVDWRENRGKRPVGENELVHLTFRDGSTTEKPTRAGSWRWAPWHWGEHEADIALWRRA